MEIESVMMVLHHLLRYLEEIPRLIRRLSPFQALRYNRTLISLNLSSNLITDKGAYHLALVRTKPFFRTENRSNIAKICLDLNTG